MTNGGNPRPGQSTEKNHSGRSRTSFSFSIFSFATGLNEKGEGKG